MKKQRYGVLSKVEPPIDPSTQEISVVDMLNFCRRILYKHGSGIRFRFDAGNNNVSCDVLIPLSKGRQL